MFGFIGSRREDKAMHAVGQFDSIRPGPLSRCTSMAAAMMLSVNPMLFQTTDAFVLEQELTEETETF
jgi:hypothetical protein